MAHTPMTIQNLPTSVPSDVSQVNTDPMTGDVKNIIKMLKCGQMKWRMNTLFGGVYKLSFKDIPNMSFKGSPNISFCVKLSNIDAINRGYIQGAKGVVYENPRREVQMMQQITGIPNVVNQIAAGEPVEIDGTPYHVIVTPWMANGDLFEVIHKTARKGAFIPMKFMAQSSVILAHTMKQIHDRQLAHMDISPENIMLDQQWKAHVGDFGQLSKTDANGLVTMRDGVFGKVKALPPEMEKPISMIKANEEPIEYQVNGRKIDVYMLGMTIFVALTGLYPFQFLDNRYQRFKYLSNSMKRSTGYDPLIELMREEPDLFRLGREGNIMYRIHNGKNVHQIDICMLRAVSMMLEVNPEKRLTMEQVWITFSQLVRARYM